MTLLLKAVVAVSGTCFHSGLLCRVQPQPSIQGNEGQLPILSHTIVLTYLTYTVCCFQLYVQRVHANMYEVLTVLTIVQYRRCA